jgi:hypothetical protein
MDSLSEFLSDIGSPIPIPVQRKLPNPCPCPDHQERGFSSHHNPHFNDEAMED